MRVRKLPPDIGWYAEMILDKNEWPPLDDAGAWMDRPIRKWVYEHCYPGIFFAAVGWILFERESDLTAFVLAWS